MMALADGVTLRRAGWLANATREVRAGWDERGCALDVAGVGAFFVPHGGGPPQTARVASGANDDEVMQALLGPAKILALALRGVFCLHASAAARAGRAVACVGQSGQGKSTLAAYLRGAGWARLADDILPVRVAAHGGFEVMPDFPQLKLPQTEQDELAAQTPAPLGAICGLRTAADGSAIPVMMPLSASETMTLALRHTVAAQLFDGALMRQHFAFAHALGAGVAGYSLSYARAREALPLVDILLGSV